MPTYLSFDIGSNSVGSAWIDTDAGEITTGVSIFPAGVDESDDKRGDPKNAKRRMTRRTRITLRRRAIRKRQLRLELIEAGLLPPTADEFQRLLETTDPWELRRKALDEKLTAHEFGRVLLHLAQRRGALGLKLAEADDMDEEDGGDDGKVTAAIKDVRAKMREQNVETFGQFIAAIRAQRATAIKTEDRRPVNKRIGPREHRAAIRNKAGSYEHCADREMIREEFRKVWEKQKLLGGEPAPLLTDELRRALDDESGDSIWRHRGLLFGQRRATWDLGTLGRCVLEPTDRCVPHADMYASRYLVVETVNNLRMIDCGVERPLTTEERETIKVYLSGPLGMEKPKRTKKGEPPTDARPKAKAKVSDLRRILRAADESRGERFRKERDIKAKNDDDENHEVNADWFSREIIQGAITAGRWARLSAKTRDGINLAILKFDPEQIGAAERLKSRVINLAGLSETQADALVGAMKSRPKPDAKRLKMSRRAVCNILPYMDEAFTEAGRHGGQIPVFWRKETAFDPFRHRWMTQIEARKAYAQDLKRKLAQELVKNDGLSFAEAEREAEESHQFKRYSTGAKGATARDRHYLAKHVLRQNGEPVLGPDDQPLSEPPPAPLISNPVVRKAIHEVRRHLVEYLLTFRRRPDYAFVELAREARMGKVDVDRTVFQNRLRDRIRKEILREFQLESKSASQQKAAVARVALAVQQGCVCPLCGKVMCEPGSDGITFRTAAYGIGCELAHIIPRGAGGHNGFANIVLAHTKCNRDMGRRTPRQLWNLNMPGASEQERFDQGIGIVKRIYQQIDRIKPSDTKSATGPELWKCFFSEQARPKKGSLSPLAPNYFSRSCDLRKIDQFAKEIKDIQVMTSRQEAATKYATRQVVIYLADALYGGKGLPERGGEQRIFTTDGNWTGRLRREWGLFFDPHRKRSKGLDNEQEQERKEKDRGDHRHHPIDAVIVALTEEVRAEWEERETKADAAGINTADEQQMENYRRAHPILPPAPFKTVEKLRAAVEIAVFGNGPVERPVCHRHVKRKLIGALHKATLYGPVVDSWKQDGTVHSELVKNRVTVRQQVIGEAPTDFLKPAHLRQPREESEDDAIERLSRRFRIGKRRLSSAEAMNAARQLVRSRGFTRKTVDPKPEKSGLVRDPALRRLLRKQIKDRDLDPDSYTKGELKRSINVDGPLTQESGVPILSVTLLWSNEDPVTIQRNHYDYCAVGKPRKLDDPTSLRLYDGQNNHHIEIRVAKTKNGREKWSGKVVSAYMAAQRKLAKLRAVRAAGIPKPTDFRKLSKAERAKYRPLLREIEMAHPLVDRADNGKDGRFVMSLCEGEMLMMRRKPQRKGELPGPVGYFVVAEIEKAKKRVVLVPHWDARAAGERKDAEGRKVPNSKREEVVVTPTDLKELAPPGKPHAVKVRVSPLGKITELVRD